jgi:hypothetical protein
MEWSRIVFAMFLAIVIFLLLRAANSIGEIPYFRVKMHEDLAGSKFPDDLSLEEKQFHLDLIGVAPRNARRAILYIAVVFAGALLLVLLRG